MSNSGHRFSNSSYLPKGKRASFGADIPSICGMVLHDLDPIHACYATDVLKVALHLMVPKVAGSIFINCLMSQWLNSSFLSRRNFGALKEATRWT